MADDGGYPFVAVMSRGNSSERGRMMAALGANVAAALESLKGRAKGGVIAILVCDSGLKYLSADLWSES